MLPPFGASSFPIRLSASVSLPRVGFNIRLERPVSCFLSGEISKCCATLHTTSRLLFTAEAAVLRVQPASVLAAGEHSHANGTEQNPLGGTVLLQAPCASFVLLHHSDPDEPVDGDDTAGSGHSSSQPFILFSFRPPGVTETQAESHARSRQMELPQTVTRSLNGKAGIVGGRSEGDLTNTASQHDMQHEGPHGGISSRPSLNLSDMSGLRDSQRSFQMLDAAERVHALKERIADLRGHVVYGSAMARIAPVEAFVDSTSLGSALELALRLRTLINDGDKFMSE